MLALSCPVVPEGRWTQSRTQSPVAPEGQQQRIFLYEVTSEKRQPARAYA